MFLPKSKYSKFQFPKDVVGEKPLNCRKYKQNEQPYLIEWQQREQAGDFFLTGRFLPELNSICVCDRVVHQTIGWGRSDRTPPCATHQTQSDHCLAPPQKKEGKEKRKKKENTSNNQTEKKSSFFLMKATQDVR